MKAKKTKRELELENAELRGRVAALEEICVARRCSTTFTGVVFGEGPFVRDPPRQVHPFSPRSH